VLVHAAPGKLRLHLTADDGTTIARGDRDYSPITLLELDGDASAAARSGRTTASSGYPCCSRAVRSAS
jgi:hypothetical protein